MGIGNRYLAGRGGEDFELVHFVGENKWEIIWENVELS